MSSRKRRSITLGMFLLAGGVALLALALGGGKKEADAAHHQPHVGHLDLTKTPPVSDDTTNTHTDSNEPVKPVEPPKVDIVFALDTTGSMGGLIAGAKRKIWAIANKVVSGQPRPDVRIGLVAYRDLGDAYVTRRFDLSEDIEDIYEQLQTLQAGGGGDMPEHVNKALAVAIRDMQWRTGDRVLRQIYLVGDAPPHEGRSNLRSSDLAREATSKKILINTVRCGSVAQTQVAWRRIAQLAGGIYASIRQDGNMYAVATPMDGRLAELNARLSSTLLAAGGGGAKRAARRRARVNAAMDTMAQAESAAFRARSGRLDSKDLLTQLKRGRKLGSFKPVELPAPMASMSPEQRKAYVAKVAAERTKLRQEIRNLATKRAKYIAAKRRAKKPGKGFDDEIGTALKKQAASVGLAY